MCDKRISIVGAGMGTADQLTGLGSRRLREAQVVVGAPRLTEGLSGELAGHAVLATHRTGEIVEFLKNEKWTRAVFLTVLLVEQNAKKALSIANRAYVLETGNITLSGDAKDLINDDSVKKAYLGE